MAEKEKDRQKNKFYESSQGVLEYDAEHEGVYSYYIELYHMKTSKEQLHYVRQINLEACTGQGHI